MTRREALARNIKIIGTRWIDVNKGDKDNPLLRSRLVGQEFRDGEDDSLFASTPPLEALRLLVSEVATIEDISEKWDKVLMFNDVSRAFFEAPVRREVCVEIPDMMKTDEDKRRDVVGLLKKSLYGTRDASANFQAEVKRFMESRGFVQGKYSPSTYWHQKKNLKTLVHGDDFVTSGHRRDASWLREELQKRFQIKTQVVGLGKTDSSEGRVLNRVVRVDEDGWEYEADQRHADLIIRGLNMQDAKS
eukprot:4319995-Karenia_brevis.AAC.1